FKKHTAHSIQLKAYKPKPKNPFRVRKGFFGILKKKDFLSFERLYGNIRFSTRFLLELNKTIYPCMQSMVLSGIYVLPGIMFSTTLSYDDISGNGRLSTENLYA